MVIWIIGLSASGKTTLGRSIYNKLKKQSPATVFVDGDEIRKIFKHDKGHDAYTMDARRKNADRICELCAWLDRQGINVVCAILSVFEESRDFNRTTYSKYFEVYIDVDMEKLRQREVKGLYANADKGLMRNVIGVDIPFTPPKCPDYIFINNDDNPDFDKIALEIIEESNRKSV